MLMEVIWWFYKASTSKSKESELCPRLFELYDDFHFPMDWVESGKILSHLAQTPYFEWLKPDDHHRDR